MLRLGALDVPDGAFVVMAIVNRTPDSFYDRGATFTDAAAMERVDAAVAEGADIVVTGEERVEIGAALDQLSDRGLRRVSCEGGPQLLGQVAAADRLDELAVTVAPRLVGGDATRITAGPALRPPARLRLRQVLADGDYLFLRYTR